MLRLAHVFLVGLLLYPVTAAPQFARAQIVRAAPTYVEPTLIFTCSSYSYYRPAISADGAYVIFESTPNGGTATNLVIDAFPTNPPTNCADHFPTPFISTGVTAGSQRADWCWDRSAGGKPKNGPVAFSNGDGIFTATPNGMNSVPATGMTNTAEMIYPSWYPDCRKLAVDVWQPNPQVNGRQWVIAQIDLTGHVTAYPLGGDAVWAGFPSVNQQNPSVVAFAGQSNGQQNGIAAYYNQNINYIWVAGGQGKYIRTVPLERNIDVNLGFLPIFQARAGWWSPDGNWFAFSPIATATTLKATSMQFSSSTQRAFARLCKSRIAMLITCSIQNGFQRDGMVSARRWSPRSLRRRIRNNSLSAYLTSQNT